MQHQESLTHNLEQLLAILPPHVQDALEQVDYGTDTLLELVLDLGRLPEARYRVGEQILGDREVTREDIDYVTKRLGTFGDDNRAGIERTLHRISAIRNRRGEVVGLTCRVGRAVRGTSAIIDDLIAGGQSVLLLGKPGVGKTTLLRESARVLADTARKRVVIVDTSNEIAGDGDIPHPGIGRARRMPVLRTAEQHATMIEAVENHMPEVIVIDEIGTEAEAIAARTIAERGVQLIGTAHGQTLENLITNPTLSDLVGGIQAVTLGDDEARMRGTQKTVLERKAPPTFDVLVELQAWNQVAIYRDVAGAVDALLRGAELQAEQRTLDVDGQVQTAIAPTLELRSPALLRQRPEVASRHGERRDERSDRRSVTVRKDVVDVAQMEPLPRQERILAVGVNRDRLSEAIHQLHVPATIVRDLRDATAVLTLKAIYRRGGRLFEAAEAFGIPVYALRGNTSAQVEQQLATLFHLRDEVDAGWTTDELDALANAELEQQDDRIRRVQQQLVDRYQATPGEPGTTSVAA